MEKKKFDCKYLLCKSKDTERCNLLCKYFNKEEYDLNILGQDYYKKSN